MQINWQRVEARFNEIDHATYGLAEFFVVGGACTVMALSLYAVLAVVFYGYLQLAVLLTA